MNFFQFIKIFLESGLYLGTLAVIKVNVRREIRSYCFCVKRMILWTLVSCIVGFVKPGEQKLACGLNLNTVLRCGFCVL